MSGRTPFDPTPPERDPVEPDDGEPCDIRIDHDLEGINKSALITTMVGQMLGLAVEVNGPFKAVVCLTDKGAIVGALAGFRGIGRLVQCLERGVSYQVTVTEIEVGRCHVKGGMVRP
jgi:hypothetical protein